MSTLLKCDQCGKTTEVWGSDRNRHIWAWARLHVWDYGDTGSEHDFCSAPCLAQYAARHDPDSPVAQAIRLLAEHGYTDGAHHKQWVLDQVLRLLAGEDYGRIAVDDWDSGIAP